MQRGQAPCGALNEKMRGCSSASETPWSGQAKFSREQNVLVSADYGDDDEAFSELRRRLDGLRQAQAQVPAS